MQQSSSADNPQPSITELAWLAGFIDGEGSFGLNAQDRKDRQRLQVTPRLTIVNTSLKTIEYIHDLLQRLMIGHLVKSREPSGNRKTRYTIEIIGYKRMQSFFQKIPSEFFITKKEQFQLMNVFVNYRLNQWKQPNGGRRAGYNGIELEVWQMLKDMHSDEGSTTVIVASQLIEKMVQSELLGDQ